MSPVEPMSAERLAEIEAREQRAMEGPYSMFGGEMIREPKHMDGWERLGIVEGDPEPDGATMEFLCQSRRDIPDLLAEVKRLQAVEAELRKDATRLDWIDSDLPLCIIRFRSSGMIECGCGQPRKTLREAIDSAMLVRGKGEVK